MNSTTWNNNGKIKLLIIVGTRPEVIRLSAVINRCRECFDTLLVHTGQNYDYNLNGVFFKDLCIKEPDIYLDVAGGGNSSVSLGAQMGHIIEKSYDLMKEVRPDALLVLGDTNSCLSAISAKRLHIPIFHMEAGNRCKDECLPEETNRRIVDIISDVNLAYSEHARRWLHACGCAPERTFVTGSPMAEVLSAHLERIKSSDIHERLSRETGCLIEKGKYFLLSAHREENLDEEENFRSLFGAVNKMAEKYDMPVLYSCHPRSRKRIEESGFQLDKRVLAHEPMGFIDYNCLQMNAYCVVSDSGTLPEESAFFTSIDYSFPAVCIRTSTERPEAMERGGFILSGIHTEGLLQSVDIAVSMRATGVHSAGVPDYEDMNVSMKIVNIIQSYTEVVNRMVWRKTIKCEERGLSEKYEV
ncbi:MAG: UDP-N-acetylglucosamine 2-epimerase (non-hydrolyzing) [Lachnospiraceae bacterium]|nr:UDP-N-acetylglucosamine 2-epimerase (non-hydrolyzing) [Lachnospiraceae bacterium]